MKSAMHSDSGLMLSREVSDMEPKKCPLMSLIPPMAKLEIDEDGDFDVELITANCGEDECQWWVTAGPYRGCAIEVIAVSLIGMRKEVKRS